MAEPYLAEIRVFSFSFAPKGWAFCNGQLLPINQNVALFSLLGTNYGGNGATNFALPNLQGCIPIHVGNGHILGESAGETTHTLTVGEVPAHGHTLLASSADADSGDPTGNYPAHTDVDAYAAPGTPALLNGQSIGTQGGSQPHANMQPFLTLNFCIALQGIFPSQN